MIGRLDQQARVNRIMIDYFSDGVRSGLIEKNSQLYKYMYNYLEIITTITSILAIRSGDAEKMAIKEEVWEYLRNKDMGLYLKMRGGPFGTLVHLPGKGGRKIFGFN